MFLFFDRSRSRLLTERKTRPKAIEDQATIMLECAKHFHFLSNRGKQFFSLPIIIQLTNRLENK